MSGEQIDDRIVEVHWDPSMQRWRMMRFRDDKPQGNHKRVVDNIIQSIADGVEKDAVSPSLLSLLFGTISNLYLISSCSPGQTQSATPGKPDKVFPPNPHLLRLPQLPKATEALHLPPRVVIPHHSSSQCRLNPRAHHHRMSRFGMGLSHLARGVRSPGLKLYVA